MITVGAPAWPGRVRSLAGLYPEPDGEIVITRYRVIELLDKLDELTSESPGQPGGDLNLCGRR